MIQRLGSSVVSKLRSGVALSSISQCVEELVLNSLDAGSTCITIEVDISSASVEVSDNGAGICENDLGTVGNRYFTSKCNTLKDLENTGSYGFRGEAIASLGKLCEKLEIISRRKTSYRTFCKVIRRCEDMGVYESTSPRSRHGTTILAHGIFHTLPVRRKLVSPTLDLERIRRCVAAIAIMHPEVSLILRNKENGFILLQTHRSLSILSIMSQVFGCYKSKAFKPISSTSGSFKVSGYVSLEGHQNKNFQYFFINKRLVLKTKFHKLTNHILSRAISKFQEDYFVSVLLQRKMSSPKSKPVDKYPGFVINLECPHNAYDITFEPAKTLVEFENWDDPLMLLTQCLNDFLSEETSDDSIPCAPSEDDASLSLTKEKLVSNGDDMNLDTNNEDGFVCRRSICPRDIRWSLHSSTAKRKANLETVDHERATKSSRNCSTTEDLSPFREQTSLSREQTSLSSYSSSGNEAFKDASSTEANKSGQNQLDLANQSSSGISMEADRCPLSTMSHSQDLNRNITISPQKSTKPLRCKKSSIYEILHKFTHKSDLSHNCSSLQAVGCKLVQDRHSQKKNLVMNCGKIDEKSRLKLPTRRTVSSKLKLNAGRTNSKMKQKYSHKIASKDGQIVLPRPTSRVCSGIQKVKNCTRVIKASPENNTSTQVQHQCGTEVRETDSLDSRTINEDAVCLRQDQCESKSVSTLKTTVVCREVDKPRIFSDSEVRNEFGVESNSSTEDNQTVLMEDSYTLDDSITNIAGVCDPGLVDNSRTVDSLIDEPNADKTIDPMTVAVDAFKTADCLRTTKSPQATGVFNLNDPSPDKNSGQVDKSRSSSHSHSSTITEPKTVVSSVTLGDSTSLENICKSGESKMRSSSSVVINDVTTNVAGDGNTSSDSLGDAEAGSCDSEWLCHYSSWQGQQVYVNLRTGNTSLVNPMNNVDSGKVQSAFKKSVQNRTLHPFASHLSHNFTPWLPRNVSPASKNKEVDGVVTDGPTKIDCLLENWMNPVFEASGKMIMDAGFPNASKTLVKVHGTTLPFNFTKDCFKDMKVIRQLDNKFILCHYTGSGERDDNLLVIVDQHAAHERVRLENFTKDLYSSSSDGMTQACIKASPLCPPCKMFFSKHELGLMLAFQTQLKNIGITFEEPQCLRDQEQHSVIIKTAPSIYLAREQSDIGSVLHNGLESNLEQLIKEQIEVLLSTKGASAALPRSIVRTLNSQACHGAIRFGDVLAINDCEDLMKSLSKCDLPFQCAHGRPSMIPLINLKSTRKEMSGKIQKLPQLWKLKKRMRDDS